MHVLPTRFPHPPPSPTHPHTLHGAKLSLHEWRTWSCSHITFCTDILGRQSEISWKKIWTLLAKTYVMPYLICWQETNMCHCLIIGVADLISLLVSNSSVYAFVEGATTLPSCPSNTEKRHVQIIKQAGWSTYAHRINCILLCRCWLVAEFLPHVLVAPVTLYITMAAFIRRGRSPMGLIHPSF